MPRLRPPAAVPPGPHRPIPSAASRSPCLPGHPQKSGTEFRLCLPKRSRGRSRLPPTVRRKHTAAAPAGAQVRNKFFDPLSHVSNPRPRSRHPDLRTDLTESVGEAPAAWAPSDRRAFTQGSQSLRTAQGGGFVTGWRALEGLARNRGAGANRRWTSSGPVPTADALILLRLRGRRRGSPVGERGGMHAPYTCWCWAGRFRRHRRRTARRRPGTARCRAAGPRGRGGWSSAAGW